MAITKQNITDHLYLTGLINNTAVQTSAQLTELVLGITDNTYTTTGDITTALSNGDITNDTYIVYTPENVVDTAQRILQIYS
jgi:hypothetical protein